MGKIYSAQRKSIKQKQERKGKRKKKNKIRFNQLEAFPPNSI